MFKLFLINCFKWSLDNFSTFSKSLHYDKTQTAKFKFTPRKPGKRTLLVDVDTTQVKDFKAAADVEVLPSKDSGVWKIRAIE